MSAPLWNTTFYKVEQLAEQQWPITAIISDRTVTKPSEILLPDVGTEENPYSS